jgi:hypothetical protein
MEFRQFGKIPRLNRLCTITEKIDGTNGVIYITPKDGPMEAEECLPVGDMLIRAGSRTRWIWPGKEDNHGFAGWVAINAQELVKLGPGTHYGEWWGGSIQRGYGIKEKRFSLFNTARWGDAAVRPTCCGVVPVLYEDLFDTDKVKASLEYLKVVGSLAAPGYLDPEGIVVYHHAANELFKATIKGDEEGKHEEGHVKKERLPQRPREKDPSKGGRRKEAVPFEGPDRRVPK